MRPHLAIVDALVFPQLSLEPTEDRDAQLLLEDRCTACDTAYALGMSASSWSGAKASFPEAASIEGL
jgi:hypothetical protein